MEYFLPIAEVYVNLPLIFILSLVVGVLSGLFGVGGGFLMTPFLIFLGVPPAYAVPNEANNILGTSISGSTTHYLKGTLDYKMGLMIVVGGVAGTITDSGGCGASLRRQRCRADAASRGQRHLSASLCPLQSTGSGSEDRSSH